MARRWLRIAVWAAGGAGLFLALAWLALWALAASDWGRAQVQALIAHELRQATGADFTLGELSGNPLTNLRLSDLRLTREGRVLAQAAEVELRYNPLALLGGSVRLGRLRLVSPRVHLPLDLPAQAAAVAGPLPLALSVARLEVVDGALMANGQLGQLVGAEGVDLAGRLLLSAAGLRLEAELSHADLNLAGRPQPASLRASFTLRGRKLELGSLILRSGPSRLEAQGALDWEARPSLRGRAWGRLADWRSLAQYQPDFAPPPEPLDFGLEADGHLADLRLKAEIRQASGQLGLSAQVNLEQPAVKAQATLRDLDLMRAGLSPEPVALSGVLRLDSQGWPGQAASRGELELELTNPAWEQWRGKSLDLKLRQDGRTLTVERLGARTDFGDLEAQGGLELPDGEKPLSAQGEIGLRNLTLPPALAGLAPPQLSAALLNGRLRVAAQGRDLDLHLRLDPSRLGAEAPIERLEAHGGRAAGAWHLREVAMEAAWLRLAARGQAGLESAELDWDLACPDLARLAKALDSLGLAAPLEPAGSIEAHGRLRGPWSGPALNLTLTGRELALGTASLGRAELELGTPAAAWPLKGVARLRINDLAGGDLAWREVWAELTADAGGARLNLSGRGPQLEISLSADNRGPLALPLRARISGLKIKPAGQKAWQQAGQAELGLDREAVDLGGLVLTQGRERLELSGRGSLDGPMQASLRLTGVLLEPWLPARRLAPETLLDLAADLTGSLARPRLQLKGRLHGLEWRRLGRAEVDFQGQLDGETLGLEGQARLDGQPVLAIQAELGLEAGLHPPRLRVTERGLEARATAKDLPLNLLAPLMPGLRVGRGRLDLDLGASGDPARPELRGRLELAGGSLVIESTGQRIDELDLTVSARGREIVLVKGGATSGGRLVMHGRLVMPEDDDPGWVELKAKGPDLLVGLGALGQVTTDLDLDLSGPVAAPQARAVLRPRSAVIRAGQTPPTALNDVVVLGPGQKPPPLAREGRKAPRIFFPGPLGSLALAAKVDVGQALRVVVDEGWVTLGGAVMVTKASGGPLVFRDSFTTDNGAIFVESRRFVVTRGQFDFAGKDAPDPSLNVDVHYRAGSTQIFITVQGSAFAPQLQLSSEPPMSQADILSTIIFGRPAASLNAGESRALSAQALALLGQGSRREIEKILGPSLSPDVVTVHSDASAGSSLEAGKYLSSDLYLRYRQNLGSEGGQNIGLEYRINQWLSLDSQVGTTRDSGVDVIFSWEFN
ncbi:MAG: translocation/assembly module TamB domain-containing protein [Thermodesulfobacteriota bacterium]